ncbi:MAG: hypothetical protein GXX85_08770 [Ignavibacteria bacterium]|nr:hypothetical protein [Ignavibacteria bacterium]
MLKVIFFAIFVYIILRIIKVIAVPSKNKKEYDKKKSAKQMIKKEDIIDAEFEDIEQKNEEKKD